jgi:hypothetical protein
MVNFLAMAIIKDARIKRAMWPVCKFGCHNPSLGLTTKARACKGEGQEGSPRVTFHAPRSVEECEGMNPTLPNELPLWELDSQWTPKFLECDFKGQNPLNWNIPYIIENLLECRCLKWAHMTIQTLKTHVMAKKRVESQIGSLTSNH